MGLKAARCRSRRNVGSPSLRCNDGLHSRPDVPGRQRRERRGQSHGTGRRTIDTPGAGPAGLSVAGGRAWSFCFTSQFLDRVYRKVEQFDVGIVVAVYLVCIVGVQRE